MKKNPDKMEHSFAFLFEKSLLPMWIVNLQTMQFLTVNKAAVKYYGYSRAEFLKMTLKDIRPCEDVPALLRGYKKALKELKKGTLVFHENIWRHRKKNGTIIFVRTTGSLIDYNGKKAVLVQCSDVTKQKLAEDILQREKVRMQNYLDIAGVLMVVIRSDQTVAFINKKGCEVLGFSREEIIGKNWFDNFIPRSVKNDVKPLFDRLVSGQLHATEYFENPIVTKNGEERIVAWHNALIKDETGKIVSTLSSGEDITERKQAEEKQKTKTDQIIRRQEGLLKLSKMEFTTLEAMLKEITGTDADVLNVERVGVWIFNEEHTKIICRDLYKRSKNSHESGPELGIENYPLYFGALRKNYIIAADNAQTNPLTSEFMEDYLKPLGITSMMNVPIHLHGKVVGGVCHEHTGPKRAWVEEEKIFASSIADMVSLAMTAQEREDAEHALAQKAIELARLNVELEQFVYVASHDLKEPLRVMSSYLQLLEKRCKDKLDADEKRLIARAVHGSARMHELIDDLLILSRIGKDGKAFVQVDCSLVLKQVLENLKAAIDDTVAVITSDSLPVVKGIELEFVQLFQNLIGNAVKFKGERAPHVHVSARREGHEWLFSVKDNGIGIDMQYAERIFLIFNRLHGGSKYEGTGVGLAIVKKIVENMGGRVWIESKLYEGSTFYFTIPDKDEERRVH